jgi:hypothetical protein
MNSIQLKGEIVCDSLGLTWKISQTKSKRNGFVFFISKFENGIEVGASQHIHSLPSALNKMNAMINKAAKSHATLLEPNYTPKTLEHEEEISEYDKWMQEWIAKYKGARKSELRSRLASLGGRSIHLSRTKSAERDAIIALLS